MKLALYLLQGICLCFVRPVYGQPEHITISSQPTAIPDNGFAGHTDTVYINRLLREGKHLHPVYSDSAARKFQRAFQASIALGYHHGIIEALTWLGAVAGDEGQTDKAAYYYRQAISWCRKTGTEDLLPGLYNALGNLYAGQGKFREGIQFYYEGIRIAELAGPFVNADYIYNNIAIALTQLGHAPPEIFSYLRKAERAALQWQNQPLRASILLNRGIVYNTQKAWDSSRIHFREALTIGDSLHEPHIIHSALSNIGISYLEQDLPQQAMPYLLRADSMKNIVDGYQKNISLYTLGEAYFKQGNYAQAEHLLQEGLQQAKHINQNLIIRELYLTLGRLYGATHRYQEAFRYFTDYIDINNRLSGENVVQQVSYLEVKYRTLQKDKEIAEKKLLLAQQERSITQKNIWITAIASGAALLTVLLVALYRSYQHRKRPKWSSFEVATRVHHSFSSKVELPSFPWPLVSF